jgi:hypothetical protein
MNYEMIEHVLDKYGFPMAVVIWMFWRDYMFLRVLSVRIATMTKFLEQIANRSHTHKDE